MQRVLIEILPGGGSAAGRKLVFDQTPLRFGRDMANPILLDALHVSRNHGELVRTPDGVWSVVSFSNNGLKAGRKKVNDAPVAIDRPTVISSGGKDLFSVALLPAEELAEAGFDTETPDSAENAGPPSRKRLNRMWIGVGAWLGILALLAVVLSTVPKGEDSGSDLPEPIAAASIQAELATPPQLITRDSSLAERALRSANQSYDQIDRRRGALSEAYHDYLEALQHTPGGVLENGLDQRRFLRVKQDLSEELIRLYDQAYTMIQGREFERALDKLNELRDSYRGGDRDESSSTLLSNVAMLRKYCLDQTGG